MTQNPQRSRNPGRRRSPSQVVEQTTLSRTAMLRFSLALTQGRLGCAKPHILVAASLFVGLLYLLFLRAAQYITPNASEAFVAELLAQTGGRLSLTDEALRQLLTTPELSFWQLCLWGLTTSLITLALLAGQRKLLSAIRQRTSVFLQHGLLFILAYLTGWLVSAAYFQVTAGISVPRLSAIVAIFYITFWHIAVEYITLWHLDLRRMVQDALPAAVCSHLGPYNHGLRLVKIEDHHLWFETARDLAEIHKFRMPSLVKALIPSVEGLYLNGEYLTGRAAVDATSAVEALRTVVTERKKRASQLRYQGKSGLKAPSRTGDWWAWAVVVLAIIFFILLLRVMAVLVPPITPETLREVFGGG